jgi:hypothetical protein
MEQAHRQFNFEIENKVEGMKAFSYLRSLMEPSWDDNIAHPFRDMLSWISRVSYEHLIFFERKLRAVEDAKGFSHVAAKLGIHSTFANAWLEIETAFRLKLGGLQIQFVDESKTKDRQTPDLLVFSGSDGYWCEVTSINPPDKDPRVSLTVKILQIAREKKVIISGEIEKPIAVDQWEDFESQLRNAAERASTDHKLEMLARQGYLRLCVRQSGLEQDIPVGIRDGIQYGGDDETHLERIARRITAKCNDSYDRCPCRRGIIVVYDRLMGDEEFNEILKSDTPKPADCLSRREDVLGVVLVSSTFTTKGDSDMPWWVHQVRNPQGGSPAVVKGRVFDVYSLPLAQSEGLVIWSEMCSGREAPVEISRAFLDYKVNVSKFLQSAENCSPM